MSSIKVVEVPMQGVTRPAPGSAVWMALDVARTKLVYCVRWDGREQRRLSTPMGLEHVQAEVARYAGCRLHVVYEACGFGYGLAWALQEQGVAVTVLAPSRVERAPGRRVKTDRLDAGQLARKLEHGELRSIYVPARLTHEHRQLGRTYAQCVRERQRAQIRIRSVLQEHGHLGPRPGAGWGAYQRWLAGQVLAAPLARCVDSLRALRASSDLQAQGLREALRALAQSAAYHPLVAALRAQPGVGPLAAIRLILELGDIERFRTRAALAHYLGLTPSEYSSGPLQHRGHILKCGPGVVRALLLQCAWAAVRPGRDAGLSAVFARLAPRIGRKRAIVAVARRLTITLRQRWRAAAGAARPATA